MEIFNDSFDMPNCLEEFNIEDEWQMPPVQCPHCKARSLIQHDENEEGDPVFYLELVHEPALANKGSYVLISFYNTENGELPWDVYGHRGASDNEFLGGYADKSGAIEKALSDSFLGIPMIQGQGERVTRLAGRLRGWGPVAHNKEDFGDG
jgi:hypothetical protein